MGIEQFYISKTKEEEFGDVFLLKDLQEKSSDGGGENLLGSPVQKIDKKFKLGDSYPIPRVFGNPRSLVNKLEELKSTLGITGKIAHTITLAASNSSLKIEKKRLFNIGVGQFPFLPLSFGIDLDFGKTSDLQIKFGAGTFIETINPAFPPLLFNHLNGEPGIDIGGKFLKENFYVKEILLAKNYEVIFKSTDNFKADFNAKLVAFKSLPEVNAKKISFSSSEANTLNAKIEGETFYLVGITVATWKSLKNII
jgi:hypothetical protein